MEHSLYRTGLPTMLGGIPIYSSEYALGDWKQFRFPKSKKKRIRAKWAKDRRNWAQEPLILHFKAPPYRLPKSALWGPVYFNALDRGEYFVVHPSKLAAVRELLTRA